MPRHQKARITISVVQGLQPGQEVRDNEIAGFGVRLQSEGGQPSYFVHRRIRGGGPIKVTIGQHGTWTPKTARDRAIKICSLLADGINPNETQKRERVKPTVAEAYEEYFADHGLKLKESTAYHYRSLFRRIILPTLGKRRIADVSRTDVSRMHTGHRSTPRQANFAVAAFSSLCSWAEGRGLREENSNPCRGIKRYRERATERYLTPVELKRLGEVLDRVLAEGTHSPYVVSAIRLLILTGARRSEILTLKWQFVDWDAALLRLPDSKTGQKLIRLNVPALDVLKQIPRVRGNPHVIVGARDGAHLVNLSKPWKSICEQAQLQNVRIHDLRHSFASTLASSGVSLPMIGALLGHTQAQTTQRYAHLFDDPLRQANDDAGRLLSQAMATATENKQTEDG